MKILVLNAGSSSLKFQLLETTKSKVFNVLCKGIMDGIGLETCQFRLSHNKNEIQQNLHCQDHQIALNMALATLIKEHIVPSLKAINAVGHRVVHGGEKYHKAVRINAKVIKDIKNCI